MCLGVPGIVIEVKGHEAVVDFGGVRKIVDAFLVEDLKPGDYVIVHAGAIIAKISEEEFKSIKEIFDELSKALEELRKV
ncbi:MAG TPA: HypC/HybG/HupF family hydrogenase formation chaperone [Desulfurococcaceae archaeon]|mgnify:CR=1 FL=1|nr:HypC/HybG/HupF family hydrogenase formation chaperone [Desulfurococcaceae archaeon]